MTGPAFDPVPRTIHQTWKTEDIPDAWKPYQQSWLQAHQDWRYVLWTDAANRALIAERYPAFLPTYDAFPRDIQRVDAAKYFILYTHGGVYVDLDCECVKPIDPLIARGGAIVGRTRDGVIECALFASPPGHPLWEVAFRRMRSPGLFARLLGRVPLPVPQASHVLLTTGTRMMAGAVREYGAALSRGAARAGLTVHPPVHFSSRSWLARFESFNGADAFVRHHYSDSWLLASERRALEWFTMRKLRWAAGALVGLAALLAATC